MLLETFDLFQKIVDVAFSNSSLSILDWIFADNIIGNFTIFARFLTITLDLVRVASLATEVRYS
jgi:hypothetical protein